MMWGDFLDEGARNNLSLRRIYFAFSWNRVAGGGNISAGGRLYTGAISFWVTGAHGPNSTLNSQYNIQSNHSYIAFFSPITPSYYQL